MHNSRQIPCDKNCLKTTWVRPAKYRSAVVMECNNTCQQKKKAAERKAHRPKLWIDTKIPSLEEEAEAQSLRPQLWIDTNVSPVFDVAKSTSGKTGSSVPEAWLDETDAQELSEEAVNELWSAYEEYKLLLEYEAYLVDCFHSLEPVEDEECYSSQENSFEDCVESDQTSVDACEEELADEGFQETQEDRHCCAGPGCCPPSPSTALTSEEKEAAVAKTEELNDFIQGHLPDLETAHQVQSAFCDAALKLSRHIEIAQHIQDSIAWDDSKSLRLWLELEDRLGTWRCDEQQVGFTKSFLLIFNDGTDIELTEREFTRLSGRMTTQNPNVKSIHTMHRATLKELYFGS